MSNYKISCEVELEANSPLEAAQIFEEWLKTEGDHYQYYVQDDSTKDIFSVDLDADESIAVLPADNYSPTIEK